MSAIWLCSITLLFALCRSVAASSDYSDFSTEDIFIPAQCDSIAKPGDHLLLEYTAKFANGSTASYLKKPSQLYHVLLDQSDELPISAALKGMCKNSTRKVLWEDVAKVDMQPIFVKTDLELASQESGVSIELTVIHITEPEDYRIFDHLKSGNMTGALDMIEEHKGINALDEWGQSALMMAVRMKKLEIVAALLNTRMPKVNVNVAKSSGYTALVYAVELSAPTIMQALLRRGADPNIAIQQEGSRGNTPLHFACLLERTKHAEMLLEYGAIPDARNEHGQRPLDLLPRDAVRSTRLYFKRIFEEAIAKQAAAAVTTLSASEKVMTGSNEL